MVQFVCECGMSRSNWSSNGECASVATMSTGKSLCSTREIVCWSFHGDNAANGKISSSSTCWNTSKCTFTWVCLIRAKNTHEKKAQTMQRIHEKTQDCNNNNLLIINFELFAIFCVCVCVLFQLFIFYIYFFIFPCIQFVAFMHYAYNAKAFLPTAKKNSHAHTHTKLPFNMCECFPVKCWRMY